MQPLASTEYACAGRDPEPDAQPQRVGPGSHDRHRFFEGRQAIVEFLREKWSREPDEKPVTELLCCTDARVSVRFEYEWHDDAGQWYRTHGNEHWEFDENGLVRRRYMSANDFTIDESERRYR